MRVGFGYDSHGFAPQGPLMLGGVEIARDIGLAGHSDGDAVLHAVTDAILGAIAGGDIGEIFPDSDPQWVGAESSIFIRQAVKLAGDAGYVVGNCDVTVITESPRLTPHKPAMRKRIAELLQVGQDAVSVKAKTNEKMGFIGRGEGVAVLAMVVLQPR